MLPDVPRLFSRFRNVRRPVPLMAMAFGIASLATTSQPLSTSALAADSNKVTIYVLRHGETDWNRQGLIQGWTDTPLNERGHVQARAVAQALIAVPAFSPAFN